MMGMIGAAITMTAYATRYKLTAMADIIWIRMRVCHYMHLGVG